jgi:hypothetical protein
LAGPRPRRALQQRPRRALRPRPIVRVARVVAPVALIGVLSSGVAAAFWPRAEYTAAVPAPVVRTPDPAAASSPASRPSLTTSSSASAPGDKHSRRTVTSFALKAAPTTKHGQPSFRPFNTPSASASKSVGESVSLKVTGIRYTTTDLNVRRTPGVDGESVTVLETGSKVSVTTGSVAGWTAIMYDQQRRWVRSDYLSTSKPKPSTSSSSSGGISSSPCRTSSGVESGLTPDAIRVYRALCARYPQVTAFHGLRPGDSGEHGSGRALDAMISNSSVGWDMAYWLRANASRLGVSEVIYSQKIWTAQRSSDGWRWMSDRGSTTANHYDHVHVTVYGYSGSS